MDDAWVKYAEEFTSAEDELLRSLATECYANYYDLVFPRLRMGGFIITDNVLWSGKALQPEGDQDESTRALHGFNRMVRADSRVCHVLLPIRDGLMVVRKERE